MSRPKSFIDPCAQSSHRSASADRIRDALFELYADCVQDPKSLIAYALCDLRHLCDCEDLAFDAQDRAGHRHYLEELKG